MALGKPPARGSVSVRVLERALDLLSALERAGRPMGVSELGRATGVPKATVQRLLSALEYRGLVQKDQARYHLGVGVVPLARAFLSVNSVASAARPVLEQLAISSGETVSLYTRNGRDRVVIARIESPYTVRVAERIGQRLPLHVGAAGVVLMAYMPREEIDRYLEGLGDIPLASGGVLSRDQVLARLERVRREGFAVSYGERRAGVVAVSAPIVRAGLGVVAAIGVSGPPARMPPEKVEQLTIEVRRAAGEVAEACRQF